jgi:hypothetical protein
MSKDKVTAWWIEADTGNVRTETLSPSDIVGSRTYENEVHLKHARNAIDVMIIPVQMAGMDWAMSAVKRLSEKARAMREELANRKSV